MGIDAKGADCAYAICNVRDIPNRRAKGFHLARLDADGIERPWHIVVVRWDRKLYGYVNVCPHHGVNLDWEREQFFDGSGTRLVCGKHGALFDVATGDCLDGPCTGARLEPIRLSVLDGDVCVNDVVLAQEDEA